MKGVAARASGSKARDGDRRDDRRTRLCTPLSYFSVPYTSSPETLNVTSLYPPSSVVVAVMRSKVHPRRLANMSYMRAKFAANLAAKIVVN